MSKPMANVLAVTLGASLALWSAGCSCGGDNNGDPDAGGGVDAMEQADADPNIDGGGADAAVPVMSITRIIPEAASRQVDTTLTVLGLNIADGASMTLENCDTTTVYDLSSTVTVATDGASLTALLAMDVTREQGIYTVTVTNPDLQSDRLECAFQILSQLPPTVTQVTPATAYSGSPGDGINSDQTIAITGTGFQPTPNVRFVKTDASVTYDALFVGFGSETDLTAVVPSETLGMTPGTYHVFVVNPDLLAGQWLVDAGGTMVPGVFTVTATPPPEITALAPQRIANASCTTTTITIDGTGFLAGATVWWGGPPGTNCAGSMIDENGNVLCPMVVDSVNATQITAHFDPCAPNGAWPIIVRNPDGQSDTFRNVEIRPNSAGHLDASSFDVLTPTFETARFRHGAEYGFDAFGNSYLYVIGGQGAAGAVLSNVEASQLDVFGNASPFAVSMQYLDADNPRVVNALTTPRQGLSTVRVGRTLFAMGGAAEASDVTTAVSAIASAERARILSFYEMPAIKLPTITGPDGLPLGSWYYRVTAVGPWGESLATREVVVLSGSGTVEVCWDPPVAPPGTGPLTYNVYRSLASDGRASSSVAIAYEVTGPCFTDTGVEELTPAPGRLRGAPTTSAATGLAAGDHLYRVSATITLANTNAWETQAGYSATVQVSAADVTNGTNAIELNWNALPDATATYDVYRWNAADEAYQLVEGGADLTATTFVDDGAAFAAPVVNPRAGVSPLPPGSLSYWTADVPTMGVAREGADAVVVQLDPATTSGVAARIIVAGGRSANSNGNYLLSAESLGVMEDGTLEAAWFDEQTSFASARAFYSLLTTQGSHDTDFPPPPEEPPCGDLDNDGFIDCDCAPMGTPIDQIDCNDADPNIHPGATEVCGDGIDQDCDLGCGGTDEPCACMDDADSDTHIAIDCGGDDCCDDGAETALGCSVANAGSMHPGALDVCGNGIDEDCDGMDAVCDCQDDTDTDGFVSIACGGGDCCDTGADTSLGCTDTTAPGIHPGAVDVCGNGVDEDCDGNDSICSQVPGARDVAATGLRQHDSRRLLGMSGARGVQPRVGVASADRAAFSGARPRAIADLVGGEPVFLVAALGDNEQPVPGGGGTINNGAGLSSFESCGVADDGHLDCAGAWVPQTTTNASTAQDSWGIDGLLYFDYLYPFYALSGETITTTTVTRSLISSAIQRFPIIAPANVVNSQIVDSRQSANTSATIARSYFKALRLLSYVYLVGGWTSSGPTGTVERHVQ